MSATCLLCGATDAQQFLEPRSIPVLQNRIVKEPVAARAFPRGEVAFSFCGCCGLVFNGAFGNARLDFSPEYDNSQTCSSTYQNYLEALAEHLIVKFELSNKQVLEIGCGKGSLLRLLCRGDRNQGVGFDPSYVGPADLEGGAVRFVRELYNGQQVNTPVDLVVCQHVLDHVADPLQMLTQIRGIIADRPGASFFCEVPDLAWILENFSFWDLCYERCSYFFPETLAWAFRRAGFEVTLTARAFQGQYIWLEARPTDPAHCEPEFPDKVAEFSQRIRQFARGVEAKMADCLTRLRQFHAEGGCAIWGAATKGAMLLNLLDPECKLVRYVVDINPNKQGGYIPGTGHLIVSLEQLRESRVAGILLMNPNYLGENVQLLKRLGVTTRLECA